MGSFKHNVKVIEEGVGFDTDKQSKGHYMAEWRHLWRRTL